MQIAVMEEKYVRMWERLNIEYSFQQFSSN